MAAQLIYTSAPQGLTAGQSGYCTVARDGELREALVRTLEQLSSFHRADSAGQHHPVISACRTIDLRGAKYHVLSRIQDAGLDFTKRTNHIAHHLIFEPHEITDLPPPALIFRDWNGWRGEWKEAPRLLGASDWGNLAQIPRSISLPAKHWESVTGDAGSAAGLMERAFANGAFLLSDADILVPLFAESVQLLALKSKSRAGFWDYTFTTRLQPEDDPHDFRWRGCQSDSPAYQAVLRKGGSFTAVNTIKAPANDLAQYARTGTLPAVEARGRPSARLAPAPARPLQGQAPARLQPVPLRGWNPDANTFATEDDEEEPPRPSQSRGWIWITLMLLVVAGTGAWAWSRSHKPEGAKPEEPKKATVEKVAGVAPVSAAPANPVPPANPVEKWVNQLPDFTTWLVNLSSDSSIKVEAVDGLKKVCDQLNQCTSDKEIKAVLECRIRSDDPLSGRKSPDSGAVALSDPGSLRGENSGTGFRFDGLLSMTPTTENIGVFDFSSPSNTFDKFRIVSFPAGASNKAVKFPKSLLRADQGALMDSIDSSLADRLRKIKTYGDGSRLELRPFVNDTGMAGDMIDALTVAETKATATNGNELNFERLRAQLTDGIKKIADQTNTAHEKITDLTTQLERLSADIRNEKSDYAKAGVDQDKQAKAQAAMYASQGVQAAATGQRSQWVQRQDQLNRNLADYQKCLGLIPTNIDDPKLDHVDLVLVSSPQSKLADRIELIRFDDSEGKK